MAATCKGCPCDLTKEDLYKKDLGAGDICPECKHFYGRHPKAPLPPISAGKVPFLVHAMMLVSIKSCCFIVSTLFIFKFPFSIS